MNLRGDLSGGNGRPAMLTLIPPANRVASLPPDEDYPFGQTPLTVAFASADDLSAITSGAAVGLAAVPELSCDDAYLLLPLRAREGLLRAFAKGKLGVLAAWFNGALVIRGEVERVRGPRLWVGDVWSAAELLASDAEVRVERREVERLVDAVNALPWIGRLALGGLLDRAGAEAILSAGDYVGVSRRGASTLGLGRDAVASSFVWCSRDEHGARVRVAITEDEDDTVTCLLSPVSISLGA